MIFGNGCICAPSCLSLALDGLQTMLVLRLRLRSSCFYLRGMINGVVYIGKREGGGFEHT